MTRMRTALAAALLAGLASLVVGLSTATAHSPTIGVVPATVGPVSLAPGGTLTIDKVVHTPKIAPKPDIYFLADTTGSMGGVISAVKTGASSVLSTVAALTTDERFGAGDYKDFQSPMQSDPYAFNNAAPIPATDDAGAAALAAIGAWSASGGLDGSEGQFFALHRIAAHAAASFRSGATPIVVWFGDAPAHDPVCSAISGDPHSITESSLTSELVGAGIRVIAISTITGFPSGLNDNPSLSAGNYTAACGTPDGTSGQATRITAATGGVLLTGVSPSAIASAIVSGLSALPVTVTAGTPVCDAGLSASITPPSQTGTSGDDFTFVETISVSSSASPGTLMCTVPFLINGKPAGPEFTQKVTINVVDRTPPSAKCVETTNPAGKNVPPAGSTTLPGPNGGKNEDGFYQVFGSDNVAVASIVIRDSASSFVSSPLASGDKVKLTQAPGATPNEKPMAGVIVRHITTKGDPILRVTDTSGNVTETTCFLPPPPK